MRSYGARIDQFLSIPFILSWSEHAPDIAGMRELCLLRFRGMKDYIEEKPPPGSGEHHAHVPKFFPKILTVHSI